MLTAGDDRPDAANAVTELSSPGETAMRGRTGETGPAMGSTFIHSSEALSSGSNSVASRGRSAMYLDRADEFHVGWSDAGDLAQPLL